MRVIEASLVAGKTEEMTAVVCELVDLVALNERSSTLFRADKVDRQQHQKSRENRPWQNVI
jgi:hypothetical protein